MLPTRFHAAMTCAIVLSALVMASRAYSKVENSRTVASVDRAQPAASLAGSDLPPSGSVEPRAGVEVDEYVQTETQTGREMMRSRVWDEPRGDNVLHVELVSYPDGQRAETLWLVARGGRECALYRNTIFGIRGEVIDNSFWRASPERKLAGAQEFPADIYPSNFPETAVIDALDSPVDGAQGMLHAQVTQYGFVTLAVRAENADPVNLAGVTFPALKIAMTTDIRSFLPSWPGLVLRVLQPLLSGHVYYFQSSEPHRFLKAIGDTSLGGPDVTTEIVRYYIAPQTDDATTRTTRR